MTSDSPAELIDANPMLQSDAKPPRIVSVDAMRGFVMLAMIFVNDLNGDVAPWWMKHYSETGFGPNGMTFVDLVFPSFIFLVGMSIPLAFTRRLARGEPLWKLASHVLLRTVSLLAIGILMVNTEEPAREGAMPLHNVWWNGLMFLSAILAFAQIGKAVDRRAKIATWIVRAVGLVGLACLAVTFRWGENAERLIQFRPLVLHHSWYGILGLIGWAYLVAAIIFGLFRNRRLPILASVALLFTLFALDKGGAFESFHWLEFIEVGEMLGTHAAIATAGLLLGTILMTADSATPGTRLRFAAWFAVGFAIAALVIAPPLPMFKAHPPLWGISKNAATPAWGLWSAAVAAAVWAVFYLIADVWQIRWLAKPWAIAGQNVLLAYLLSEGLGSWLSWTHLADWYDRLGSPDLTHAVGRSLALGVVLLAITAVLNRVGFSVRL